MGISSDLPTSILSFSPSLHRSGFPLLHCNLCLRLPNFASHFLTKYILKTIASILSISIYLLLVYLTSLPYLFTTNSFDLSQLPHWYITPTLWISYLDLPTGWQAIRLWIDFVSTCWSGGFCGEYSLCFLVLAPLGSCWFVGGTVYVWLLWCFCGLFDLGITCLLSSLCLLLWCGFVVVVAFCMSGVVLVLQLFWFPNLLGSGSHGVHHCSLPRCFSLSYFSHGDS